MGLIFVLSLFLWRKVCGLWVCFFIFFKRSMKGIFELRCWVIWDEGYGDGVGSGGGNGTCGLRFLHGDDFCPHGFFVFCFFDLGAVGIGFVWIFRFYK